MRGPRAARIGGVKDAAVFCKAEMIGRMLGDLISPELQLVKSKASERDGISESELPVTAQGFPHLIQLLSAPVGLVFF